MRDEKILFIGDSSRWSVLAADFTRQLFRDVEVVLWDYGHIKPPQVDRWEGDRIFSFKADLLLASRILNRCEKTAINFHPSSPEFRGIGGYEYAIHDECPTFGVTCHHMTTKIDSGSIIKVQRFSTAPGESVESLRERTAAHAITLFYDIVGMSHDDEPLPESNEEWGDVLYTRAALEEFKRREKLP